MRRSALAAMSLLLVASAPARAGDDREEIRYLLESVAESGCTFTRNGTEHTAAEARAHLALKLERADSRVTTADEFIEQLASASSWTGRPYVITCAGEATPSGDWLRQRLDRYRAGAAGRDPGAAAAPED